MDIYKNIESKRRDFESFGRCEGIDAILSNFKCALAHFENGKNRSEDYLFTDVIYRTNQVYEGILKESYSIFSGKDASRKSPNEIEKYLKANNVYSEFVLIPFENYRNLRNKSTHNHQMVFDEKEAFLAITSVAAFCYASLDKMIFELSAKAKKLTIQPNSVLAINTANDLLEYLRKKMKEDYTEVAANSPISEISFLGALSAVLSTEIKGVSLSNDKLVSKENLPLKPDLVAKLKEQKIIFEVKIIHPSRIKATIDDVSLRSQLNCYMEAANSNLSICILLPNTKNDNAKSPFLQYLTHYGQKQIVYLTPIALDA